MNPLPEFVMRCLAANCRRSWLRFGNTPTLCPFCGSVDTSATRIARTDAA